MDLSPRLWNRLHNEVIMAIERFDWPEKRTECQEYVSGLSEPHEWVNENGRVAIYTGNDIDILNAIRNPVTSG